MRMLVLGGNGMAGHMIVRYFRTVPGFTVFYTTRDRSDMDSLYLDASDFDAVEQTVEDARPDVIVNGIGILNQHAERNVEEAYRMNGLLPHVLAEIANRHSRKFIHISTDCVFSGERGGYTETDKPDGTSVYAKSKAFGEIRRSPHLTIRTSIIGEEIRNNGIGLFRWFMSQEGTVPGYTNVPWNGVTTLELAKAIQHALDNDVSGLVHVAHPKPISKHDLLHLFARTFQKTNVNIVPDRSVHIDRTLASTRTDYHYPLPSYESMINEMREWVSGHG
jgi:dTDP-4-dehydrorhamnose reductase